MFLNANKNRIRLIIQFERTDEGGWTDPHSKFEVIPRALGREYGEDKLISIQSDLGE